jgi:hypothetical protein
MRRDEKGGQCPATLGEYRDICVALTGEHSDAVRFLDARIAEQGRDMLVLAPDSQMREILMPTALASHASDASMPLIDASDASMALASKDRFRKAARARAVSQTPERRTIVASRAANARWTKRKKVIPHTIGFVPGYKLEDYTTTELAVGLRDRCEFQHD